jgi:hypothetical protein
MLEASSSWTTVTRSVFTFTYSTKYKARCTHDLLPSLRLPLPTMFEAIDIRVPLSRCITSYVESTQKYAEQGSIFHTLSPLRFASLFFEIAYVLFQNLIVLLFAPAPPKSKGPLKNPRGRIAVVGAGLTGISSAAYAAFTIPLLLAT